MKYHAIAVLALATLFLAATAAEAQVSIRAPFTQVDVGPEPFGGVRIRVPFAEINVPPDLPVYHLQSLEQDRPPVVSRLIQPVPVFPGQQDVPLVPPQQLPPSNSQPLPPQPIQPDNNQQLPQQLPPLLPLPQQQPPSIVIPPSLPVAASTPITHYDFARSFVPIPGRYEINFIHPGICKKVVRTCFTLPPGNPCVRVGRRSLEFDYGHCCVEIHFALFGHVRVEYD